MIYRILHSFPKLSAPKVFIAISNKTMVKNYTRCRTTFPRLSVQPWFCICQALADPRGARKLCLPSVHVKPHYHRSTARVAVPEFAVWPSGHQKRQGSSDFYHQNGFGARIFGPVVWQWGRFCDHCILSFIPFASVLFCSFLKSRFFLPLLRNGQDLVLFFGSKVFA